jgi:AcrR family transcriptional regulator
LAAEKLARRLGVSRGSFYWHFENAGHFEAAVLAEWEERWTDEYIRKVEEAGGDSRQQLALLILATSREDASLYSAAKRMAQRRPELREVLSRVDERRTEFVRGLLLSGGVREEEARVRAEIIYAWAMGQMLISGSSHPVSPSVSDAVLDFAFG